MIEVIMLITGCAYAIVIVLFLKIRDAENAIEAQQREIAGLSEKLYWELKKVKRTLNLLREEESVNIALFDVLHRRMSTLERRAERQPPPPPPKQDCGE